MSKTIQFTDTSTNANTYFWDFGDGNTSIERNPIHTYQEDGEYVVTHTVTNDFGEASIEQTVSLGDTQVVEPLSETEPNPINPPPGYNPLQGEFLTGTLSPEGQWYWDGYTWNTLEPQPSFPPVGYSPTFQQLQVGALSSNEQWVWDGYQWNLNVGVEEQEPAQEQTEEEPVEYRLTLNEESEGNLDLIFLQFRSPFVSGRSFESFLEGTEIDFVIITPTGTAIYNSNTGNNEYIEYDHFPSAVQFRPFIITPEDLNTQDLNLTLIEDNIQSLTRADGTYEEGTRSTRYRLIMPSQDVSITATAFLPQQDTEESDVDVDIPEEEDLGTGLGGGTDEQTQEGEDLIAYNLTLNEESEGNLDLINLSSGGTYTEGDEIEFIVFFVIGYDHSPSDVQLRPFITTPENLEIQLIEDNSFTFSTGQEGRDAKYRFTMPGQDVSITARAFLP